NDIAQQTTWNTQEIAGRSVYVELVDGHTGSGYAWLAVGRFSADLLNPSEYPNAVRKAAELIADYQLSDYRPDLVALLREFMSDAETSSRIAHAIVALRPDARLAAVAEALSISASGKEQRIQGAAAIIAQEPDDLSRFLEQTFRLATSAQQLRLTEELAADRSGATLLLALATSGKVAPRLLTQPTVEPKLKALNDESINGQLASLLAELPDENVEQQKLIDARQKAFFNETASVEIGVSLFRKNCAVCHQVAGQGKQIGPNLDGIGNRGLSRLIEDLLAPNRNVDVAFRATTIVTLQGKVLTGLVRRIDGDRLILVDGKGAEVAVPVDSIDEKVPSKLSPMPANFVESLSEPDFRHLVTYLLSLR
ncbi:MAG: c-type cytochrome, partial [Planctomycetota bacterium]|nr:c-type cytochrome [Planctomycetota bacterium]